MDEVAELEFGLAEGMAGVLGDEQTGHAPDIGGDGLGDARGQFLGLGLLLGRQLQRAVHGSLRECGGALLPETVSTPYVYKKSNNYGGAHTREEARRDFA